MIRARLHTQDGIVSADLNGLDVYPETIGLNGVTYQQVNSVSDYYPEGTDGRRTDQGDDEPSDDASRETESDESDE